MADRRRGRPSGARRLPGLLPRPLTRERPRGHPRDPRRQAVLPAARRRAAPAHGRPAVEPPLPLLSRAGRVRPDRLLPSRARRRLRRAAVARGLQRRLPPGRSRAHRGRRDAIPARPGGRARLGSLPRPPLCGATRSPSWPSGPARPRTRGDPRCPRLPPRRPAPVQAGAALGQRRSPCSAQPRRRARRRHRGTRRRERGRARLGAARGGAAGPGARQAAQRRRGGPRSGRRARRDVGVLRGDDGDGSRTSSRSAHPAPRVPMLAIDHVALSQPFDAFDEAVLFYRTLLGLEPGGSQDLAAPDGLVRSRALSDGGGPAGAQRPRARRAGRAALQHVAFLCDDVLAVARAMRERGPDRCRSRTTTTTTSTRGSTSNPGSSRSSASWTSSSTATRAEARSCTATRRPSGACSSRWSSAGAATRATERPTRRSAWPRNVGRAPAAPRRLT